MGKKRKDFEQYHQEHPEVYERLVELSKLAKEKGFDRYGIKSLIERVRWHFHIEKGRGQFVINGNHAPFYARLIAEREPSLKDFFIFKPSEADEA